MCLSREFVQFESDLWLNRWLFSGPVSARLGRPREGACPFWSFRIRQFVARRSLINRRPVARWAAGRHRRSGNSEYSNLSVCVHVFDHARIAGCRCLWSRSKAFVGRMPWARCLRARSPSSSKRRPSWPADNVRSQRYCVERCVRQCFEVSLGFPQQRDAFCGTTGSRESVLVAAATSIAYPLARQTRLA